MSQDYDSDRPEQDLPHGGPDNPLGHERGYSRGQIDTRSPRRGRKILLFAIGVIAVAVWTTWGGSIVSMNPTAASSAPATSKTVLSVSQIASQLTRDWPTWCPRTATSRPPRPVPASC